MAHEHAGMIPGLRPPAKRTNLRARELDFNSTAREAPLPEYKPMFDVHLQHLWVNPRIRHTMQTAGFLDEAGKPVDVDAHRRKLYVIEQELAQADAVERHRAMDKERKRQEMMTFAKRHEAHHVHLEAVRAVRENRRQQRAEQVVESRSAASLPAIA
mmetsp:Transcript_76920/g.135531  ORF Transcript_76920/g.135531 Transcript_76920/m.135531 type:complete len:157 (-) Transcript_76920:85-555(-)|eukprot:CAMPEP_0197648274 /NCGR_PEP_ID=MMETSP1338-20131121/27658_1 /TAXON_ID=43686 ORGANISM="Pelagodinium beii, Strain RCC1491" /NCGR_SAMPLE_ID=MMETSP1338 /ASSEMBLY_ACC=CAM_ASM_000754 /LENGTH=156 /DNA_ID=CAMNT_0043222247 /DNA_START=135 /DNA_END=605 /DNA_ORIENTATION=-